jgi:hypothetical protein
MSNTQTIPWRRISVEAAAIVASILLAFAIDAWWGDRDSRKQLGLELANVMSELEDNRKRVELEIALLGRITLAGSTLLDAMSANERITTVIVPDSLAWLTTVWSPTLDASFGAVDALVSSGRLAQVENPALRSGLAGIRAQFEDALEEELNARMVQYTLIFPLLVDKADLQVLYQYDDEYFSTVRYSDMDLPSHASVEYPNSLAIRNTIRDRMGWLRTGRDEMGRLLVDIDSLIALLQAADK